MRNDTHVVIELVSNVENVVTPNFDFEVFGPNMTANYVSTGIIYDCKPRNHFMIAYPLGTIAKTLSSKFAVIYDYCHNYLQSYMVPSATEFAVLFGTNSHAWLSVKNVFFYFYFRGPNTLKIK